LFAGDWSGRDVLFVSGGEGAPGPADFNHLHTRFLAGLRRVAPITRGGDGLVEEIGALWETAASRLDRHSREVGRDALRMTRGELHKVEIACGLCHGDFVPWNTRVRDGRLFVFDWRSAEWEMPLWWDVFHFDLEVDRVLGRESGIEMERLDAPVWNGLYLLYLL